MEKPWCYIVLVVLLFITNEVVPTASVCSQTSPCTPLKGGNPFRKPTSISQDVNLNVAISNFTLDWLTTSRRLYNGEFPGPTLYWKAGDTVKVVLNNNLEEPDYQGAMNTLSLPNTTNIHTHGLHISSQEPQDNVLIKINPGQSYTYTYKVHPQQPVGTYFYHPHNHGSGYFQNLGGMSGMLIIEDDPKSMPVELNAVSCPKNCDNEVPLVFQLFQYKNDEDGSFSVTQKDIHDNDMFRLNNIQVDTNPQETLEAWLEDPKNNIQYMLVNGQNQPVLQMRPGEIKRFRLLNSAGLHALALSISSSGSSNCDVYEIALDGHYLDKPRILSNRTFLVASARADWLVKCSASGDYMLQSSFVSADDASLGDHPKYSGNLLTIRVTGTPQDPPVSFPTKLPARESFEQDLRNVKECDIGGRFAVEVTATDTMNREDYSEKSIRYKAEVGTVQEWFLTNTEYVTSHPIHMHINAFQVISYNKYTGPYGVDDGGSNWKLYSQNNQVCTSQHSNYNPNINIPPPNSALQYLGHDENQKNGGLGYAQIGEWRDTLLVPPLSNITIRFNTDTFTGIVLVHCHLLADADEGMSMLTEIVEKGANLSANITSDGAYPWSCMKNEPLYTPQCGGSSMKNVPLHTPQSGGSSMTHVSIFAFVTQILAVAFMRGG